MTVRGTSTPRNRARQGVGRVGRVVCAAVVAVLAALAVLAHHELSATPTTGHVMAMPAGDTASVAGHRHGRTVGQAALNGVPQVGGVDRAACSGTAMQHCSAAGLEALKLRAPLEAPVLWSPAEAEAVVGVPEATGTVERAPPDLSVLSQLRI